jgi:hypothetical protein
MTNNKSYSTLIVSLVLLFTNFFATSNALRRFGSTNHAKNAIWGTKGGHSHSCSGWAIDQDSCSPNRTYHVIGASRSGFYLGNNDDNNKLVPCTRYGQRVKKPKKAKSAHGDVEDDESSSSVH